MQLQKQKLFSSEKEFIVASLLNHSDTALKLSTIKDIFAIKSTNCSFNTKAGKLQFLANIREKLKNLPYNSIELQKITMYINEKENSLNAPVTRRTIRVNFALSQHDKCKDCTECTNTSLEVRTSLRNPTGFLEAITPLVQAFKDPYYDIRNMQSHDRKLALEIAKLDKRANQSIQVQALQRNPLSYLTKR